MWAGSFVKIFGVKYTGTTQCTATKTYFATKPARLDLYKARVRIIFAGRFLFILNKIAI
ncbi:MAG TPA: hypothetical protein PJ990_09470 [Saprospiraceae bacterium]|nr:hypothetical protein [Saprospiraceae bacterium]